LDHCGAAGLEPGDALVLQGWLLLAAGCWLLLGGRLPCLGMQRSRLRHTACMRAAVHEPASHLAWPVQRPDAA
jgi:hypothetical protein